MKEEKLKELIDKYYNGESSAEEEKILKEYLAGNEVIPGFAAEKEFFSYYSSLSGAVPEPSEDLEQRILGSIDKYEKRKGGRYFTKKYLIPLSLAASILIITGSYFFLVHKTEPEDTYTDPVIAYAETMKILNTVSVKLNKGTQALHSIRKINSTTRNSIQAIDRSASLINASFDRIRIVERLSETDTQNLKTNNR